MRRLVLLLLLGPALHAGEVDRERARTLVAQLQADLEAVVARVAPAVGAVVNYHGSFDEKTGRVFLV
ncbi:MAG: hypothetical protein ACE5JG_06660, partial [Planctomycetota bacterium]